MSSSAIVSATPGSLQYSHSRHVLARKTSFCRNGLEVDCNIVCVVVDEGDQICELFLRR